MTVLAIESSTCIAIHAGKVTCMARAKLFFGALCAFFVASVYCAEPPDLNALLQERGDISTDDLRQLGDGFIAKQLNIGDPATGLVLVGIMKLDSDPGSVHSAMSRAQDMLGNSVDVGIKALNVIAEPARDDEFAAYELTKVEKEALESCELGDCRVKLTAELINYVQSLDYQAEEDAATFTSMYRQQLTEMVRDYQQTGNRALWVYRDKEEPLRVQDGFEAALEEFSAAVELFPNLIAHLVDYPNTQLEGEAEEFLFWSVLDFGQRPTLTVNHVASIRPANPEFGYVVMIKNIYANHYFGGRVTLGVVLSEGALDAPGTYLVLIDQLLYDGRLNRILRAVVKRGIVNDMENRLRFIRELIATQPDL